MNEETRLKLWDDFHDLMDKYAGEKANYLIGVLATFLCKEAFDYAPSRDEVLHLIQESLNVAYEWHLKEQQEENKND